MTIKRKILPTTSLIAIMGTILLTSAILLALNTQQAYAGPPPPVEGDFLTSFDSNTFSVGLAFDG